MNKALHVFVYLFLALAGAGLYFESQLNAQRELLTRRSRLQEDYFVKLAATIARELGYGGASRAQTCVLALIPHRFSGAENALYHSSFYHHVCFQMELQLR